MSRSWSCYSIRPFRFPNNMVSYLLPGWGSAVRSSLALVRHYGKNAVMEWIQKQITLPAVPRGFHLITEQLVTAIPEIAKIQTGLLHVFIMHTSASLTVNENADPDVPLDLETSLNALAPEDFPYRHTCEGPDDMPAHVKASLMGSSVNVPVRDGRLCLGTWQGIYLCEHRNRAAGRRLTLTLQGKLAD